MLYIYITERVTERGRERDHSTTDSLSRWPKSQGWVTQQEFGASAFFMLVQGLGHLLLLSLTIKSDVE